MPTLNNLSGKRFGRWLVLGRGENNKTGHPIKHFT